MEPPLRDIGISTAILVLLCFCLIFPAGVIAQEQTTGGGNQLKLDQAKDQVEIQDTKQASHTLERIRTATNASSLDEDMFFEDDQMWNRNPNPEWDFRLYGQGIYAGDINGDNSNDFIVTDSLESKTAVFFGGTSKEPNDFIDQELIPVGDLNGDGHADAVAVGSSESNSVEIYKGTDSGYSATGATLDNLNPTEFEILGFVDFDGDGNDDMYAYSQESEDLILVFGKENFADITVEPLQGELSNYPKKVIAKDIDQDDRVEIVEFQGIFGDGHIQILEVGDVELSITPEDYSSFPFNSFPDEASDTDLHLIDVNDNGHDDIYISLGRDSPKYIMEYDPDTGSYNSEKEIMEGELVPAGDLNNDGHHDFIMGDPDDSHAPYIAYGAKDLPSKISLDVQLNGNGGENWSWEMGYNPYSRFGDLDGDGIDDAVLSHSETDGESIFYGRRMIQGHSEELSSDNSEFQLYPRGNFFNTIYEVEELGDVNSDGVDDFAMVLQDQGRVEIYHGGSSISESPDQSIHSGYNIESITKGDFTGHGTTDIITISQGLDGLQIEIFEGENSFKKIMSINVSDFQDAEYNDVSGVNNIGDVNGDGSSDFLIGSGSAADTTDGDAYLHKGYIFHGGSPISSSPDDNIDMDPSNDFFSVKIDAAVSATALGDLDGDGLGDFAVGSSRKGEYGEVAVYLSASNEPTRLTTSTGGYFGMDLVSGDFNGDGIKDLAVSVPFADTVTEIYYGKENFETTPDQSLILPDFFSEENESDIMIPSLETIPDLDSDGKDELLIGSSGVYSNHAAIYSNIDSDNPKANLVKGANADAGLGGTNFFNKYGTMATGDFTDNGALDVVISQFNDNNDGIATSRVYRYELSDQMPPAQVQGVEIKEQDNGKVLSWQESEADDLDGYLVYSVDDNSELSEMPLTVQEETEYVLPDELEGVQSFVVSARDIYGLVGDFSTPAVALYPTTVSFNFNSGWNLVAFALEDDAGQSVLQELTSGPVYSYDGGYQEVEQLESGQAYWAKFSETNNHEIKGLPVIEKTIELRKGWNLIGGIGGDLPLSSVDDPEGIIIPETVYSFDQSYISVDTLGPARGYWIRSSAGGTVTLTHPKLLEQRGKEIEGAGKSLDDSDGKITESFNKITVFDDNHSAELFFGQELPKSIDKRRYSLPPMPPGDVFDARFDGNRRLIEDNKVDILLNSIDENPLYIKVDPGSDAQADQFVVKEFADGELLAKYAINASEENRLKHKKTDAISLTPGRISKLEQQEVPEEFDLEQNYPNPFNLTTQIKYSVAEATDVKIDIFNILGRRVATLVNERQQPGTYEVTFDGSNFASGIYLYRLQAGDFTSTKKSILAK